MKKDNPRENINIELLRIVACLFVISIHLVPTYAMEDGIPHKGILFYDGMTRVAVPIFFMISGYFLSAEKSIKKQYKRFVIHILLPTAIAIFFVGILLPIVLNVFLGMNEEVVSLGVVISRLLGGRIDEFQFCFHMWYIVDLTQCYILIPLIQMLCSENAHVRKIRHYILFVGFFAGVLVPTYVLIVGENIANIFSYMPITIGMWYMLLGYETRIWMEKREKSKRLFWGGTALYLVSVGILFCMTYSCDYLLNQAITGMFYNYGFIAVPAAAIGLAIALLNVSIKRGGFVCRMFGKTTFGIYLIHPVIYSIIWHLGIEKLIDGIGQVGFLLIFILLTFILTFLIVWLIQKMISIVIRSLVGGNQNG